MTCCGKEQREANRWNRLLPNIQPVYLSRHTRGNIAEFQERRVNSVQYNS